MTVCLIGLGSNLGDREATLRAAVEMLRDADGLRVDRCSGWHRSPAAGGPAGQDDFLNAVVLADTNLSPPDLLASLHHIEHRLGRERHQRWAARTLDLDLLLYGDQVIDSPTLTVPHPRMSFRPFVIEPAAEVAGHLKHPLIGWTMAELRDHLLGGADVLAISSPQEHERHDLAATIVERFGGQIVDTPSTVSDALWPPQSTSWLALGTQATTASPDFRPKLSILFRSNQPPAWEAFMRLPDRGPTLVLPEASPQILVDEALAAICSVWPDLGPQRATGVQCNETGAIQP